MTIFAEATAADLTLQTVVTAIVLGLITAVQTWIQRKRADKDKAELAAKAEVVRVAASQTKTKVDSVYEALNGSGLMGQLKQVITNQQNHETNDVEQFNALHGRMDTIETLVRGNKK